MNIVKISSEVVKRLCFYSIIFVLLFIAGTNFLFFPIPYEYGTVENYADFFGNSQNKILNRVICFIVYHLPVLQLFGTKGKIAMINSPLLIIHSIQDRLIPSYMAKINASKNQEAKLITSDYGDHNHFYISFHDLVKYINNLN